jgi:hypothetical protein
MKDFTTDKIVYSKNATHKAAFLVSYLILFIPNEIFTLKILRGLLLRTFPGQAAVSGPKIAFPLVITL